MSPGEWRATKAQKEQIKVLLEKLNWKLEDYGDGLTWENMYWLQAVSIISGAEWCLEHPKQWKKDSNN